MKVILQAKDVRMYFGGVRAVDGVSMEVREGEILGIIGPNGSGKTSFFNVLTGAYKATSGEVIFHGENITRKPSYITSERGISRTFQNIRLFTSMTVEENVLMGMHNHIQYNPFNAMFHDKRNQQQEKEHREKIDYYLDLLDISHLKKEMATNLAYGNQRKVELARALASKPTLLLLDELTAGMNDVEAHQLMDKIREIRKMSGITIMMIEHNMNIMMTTAERIVAMDSGKKIAEGFPSEIQKNPLVIESYLGKEE